MKKALSFLLASVLLAALTVSAFAAGTPVLTLSADKETLGPGESVTLTLTLDQALTELNNYQFNVLYDAQRFAFKGSEAAPPAVVSAPRQDERSGKDCISVSGLSTEGLSVELAAGSVAALTFTALEEAEPGETEFTVCVQALPSYADPARTVELSLINEAKVTLTQEAGSTVMPGDVNGDGVIDVADALAVYKHVRGKQTLKGDAFTAADVTGNGVIDVADALNVYKYVRGKITSFSR
ncbi:MAG: dockerin type I domain-containing protein [Oscillospiraceae bacterium]|nr:dockerin type I domain-containing protein [Oscillospiraceae bacterium]